MPMIPRTRFRVHHHARTYPCANQADNREKEQGQVQAMDGQERRLLLLVDNVVLVRHDAGCREMTMAAVPGISRRCLLSDA